jgi:DNA repair photolyase
LISSKLYQKGRGAQIVTHNPYFSQSYVQEHFEGLDEEWLGEDQTQIIFETAKTILNQVKSPDVGMDWSINPYQGCEHGCVYCYARNSHQYWGYSAGLDFESKIIVKRNAAELLRKRFDKADWKGEAISLSGNTDCYQPLERKFKLTRSILEVCLEYGNPVGVLTKNSLVIRDSDIIQELAKNNLIKVLFTITSLREDLRLKLEPRTATYKSRLQTLEKLSKLGVPCGIMAGPIIPGLNNYDTPQVIKAAAEHGALFCGYTVLRLNGAIKDIFSDWLEKNYPNSHKKIFAQVQSMHGGNANESNFGRRMKGEGQIADAIHQMIAQAKRKYMNGLKVPEYDFTKFKRPEKGQLNLF